MRYIVFGETNNCTVAIDAHDTHEEASAAIEKPTLTAPDDARAHAQAGAGAGAGAGASVDTQNQTIASDDTFTFTQDKVVCPGGIDYGRVVDMFHVQLIKPDLITRIEALTNKPAHLFLKQGLFFAHRDLEVILDAFEAGEPFYLYTGRGPSRGSLHLGHVIPFEFTRYLQEAFQVPVVNQLTDDEKFLKKGLTLEEVRANTINTVKDIIALGFDPELTYIFTNFNLIQQLYPVVCEIQRHLTCNQVSHCFGVSGSDSVGRMAFPAIQMAPCFSGTFPVVLSLVPEGAAPEDVATPHQDAAPSRRKPRRKRRPRRVRCLVPCGVDQDPYFRQTRDVARALKHPKPAVIHAKFLPSLDGVHTKMNSTQAASSATTSKQSGPIMLSDTPKAIRKKIGRAFSGGQVTLEDQRRLGANLDVDVPIKYLSLFMKDTERFATVAAEYQAGRLTSGQVKQLAAEVVTEVVVAHQKARATVTNEAITKFMTPRPLFPRKYASCEAFR